MAELRPPPLELPTAQIFGARGSDQGKKQARQQLPSSRYPPCILPLYLSLLLGTSMVRGRATARGARRGAASAAASSAADENGTTAPASAAADSTPASLDNAPASDSNTGAVPPPTARRGGATTGTRGNGGGRLRPNFRRRDEAERDKRAREEEQKAAKRAAEERRARGRSRARSKRSRGDAMGSRGGRGGITTASGPFSGGAAASGMFIRWHVGVYLLESQLNLLQEGQEAAEEAGLAEAAAMRREVAPTAAVAVRSQTQR